MAIGLNRIIPVPVSGFGLELEVHNSTYTFIIGDELNKVHTSSDATTYTWTIPPNSTTAFDIGSILSVYNEGAGDITIARDTGVALRKTGDSVDENKALPQYTVATITKVGTDSWIISGI